MKINTVTTSLSDVSEHLETDEDRLPSLEAVREDNFFRDFRLLPMQSALYQNVPDGYGHMEPRANQGILMIQRKKRGAPDGAPLNINKDA